MGGLSFIEVFVIGGMAASIVTTMAIVVAMIFLKNE
jgi:hypothetical protein